jgi:voltage-gated potassium channel
VFNPVESDSQLVAEHKLIKKQLQAVSAASLAVLLGGTVFYHLIEKFSWVDAVYFCTISLTTIGYGDIVPKTNGGKLFTSAYVLVGIGIIATFANIMIKNAVLRHKLKQIKRKKI